MRKYRTIELTYVAPDADLSLFKFARRAGDKEKVSNVRLEQIQHLKVQGIIDYKYV